MRRAILTLCMLTALGCESPPKRKQVDPDLWDPRHEALLNQEESPPERKEPEYTRASRSSAASATLSESDGENRDGVKGLRKATKEQERAAERVSAKEDAARAREVRWVDRKRATHAADFALAAIELRAALVRERTLGVLLEYALAHGSARGEPRAALRVAEQRAAAFGEEGQRLRERARRAASDAALQRRLFEAGTGRAQASLRAQRKASARHLEALQVEEAALRADEAAQRLRRGYFGG